MEACELEEVDEDDEVIDVDGETVEATDVEDAVDEDKVFQWDEGVNVDVGVDDCVTTSSAVIEAALDVVGDVASLC